MTRSLFSVALLCFFYAFNLYSQQTIIYGTDDRHDLDDNLNSRWLDWASSTLAMIDEREISFNKRSQSYDVSAPKLSSKLCPGEMFLNQMIAGKCSAFLVAPDIVVTAGHCLSDMTRKFSPLEVCKKHKWVFDYGLSQAGVLKSIDQEDVYECDKILERELTEFKRLMHRDFRKTNSSLITKKSSKKILDFSVIKLTKPVKNRKYLKFRTSGKVGFGEPVVMIGHPMGLPTKVTIDATVSRHMSEYFFTNLDAYGGNSGSAVFNDNTGLVEGILARGDRDFVLLPTKRCFKSIVVPDTASKEEVSSIGTVKNLQKIVNESCKRHGC